MRMFSGALLAAVAVTVYFIAAGVSTRPEPGGLETWTAHAVRGLAVRAHSSAAKNPVPLSAAVIKEGMEHFADHCAVCHDNNGSGNTEMGRGLYPRAPDMRLAATQGLSDAELFYIIENGVRFTGMPGWSTGTQAGAESSWQLVHFIRHMPALTDEEIERLESQTPRSREDVRQELEEERFLRGERE